MSGIVRLLKSKWNPPQIPPGTTFSGQTILITGGSGGLGLETAIHFVNLGAARVIITARTAARGAEAKTLIEQRTGKQGIVEVRELDMSSFAGCVAFAEALEKDVTEVNYVLLNAGVHPFSYQKSSDGFEAAIQVNVLSTTLLAILLLPWMAKAKPKDSQQPQHLGVVASGLHTKDFGPEFFKRDDYIHYYNEEKNYPGGQAMYAMSKLFVMYAFGKVAELSTTKSGSPPVIINTMCPGMCKSDLGREVTQGNYLLKLAVNAFMNIFAKSGADGAITLVLAALTKPEENGKYIRHYGTPEDYEKERIPLFETEEGKARAEVIWKEISTILEKSVPKTSSIIQ